MEGGFTGSNAQETGALWQGRLRTGGALVAGGAAMWLVHSVMIIVALVAIFSAASSALSDIDAVMMGATVFMVALLVSLIAVLLAAFLIGAGLIVYQTGTRALAWTDFSGAPRAVTDSTRTKAKVAAVFAMIYGGLGVVSAGFLAALIGATDFGTVDTAMVGILVTWIVASVLLIVAAAALSSFLGGLTVESAGLESGGGAGLLVYAIINAIAVSMLAGSLLAVYLDPLGASLGLIVPLAVGGIMELLVVPIIGIVIFSLLIVQALKLRTIRPGTHVQVGVYTPAVPVMMPMYPVAPVLYPPPPPVAYAPPPAAAAPPQAPAPAPPVADPTQTAQARLEELGRAVAEQKELLFRAEQGLVDGRLDTATYSEIVQNRKEQIAKLEQEIRALGGPPPSGSAPGPAA